MGKSIKKAKLYDAQQIGWFSDSALFQAADVAKQTATDQAMLAYQRTYAEAYDNAFKAEFERSVYQSTAGNEAKEQGVPF